MEFTLTVLLILLLIILITTLPLHLAVKMLGGRTTFIKTFLVLLISGIITLAISAFFIWGGLIAFIILIWIYSEMFRISFFRAFFVWLIQILLIVLFTFIFAIAGISLFTFSLFL